MNREALRTRAADSEATDSRSVTTLETVRRDVSAEPDVSILRDPGEVDPAEPGDDTVVPERYRLTTRD